MSVCGRDDRVRCLWRWARTDLGRQRRRTAQALAPAGALSGLRPPGDGQLLAPASHPSDCMPCGSTACAGSAEALSAPGPTGPGGRAYLERARPRAEREGDLSGG